MTDLQRRPARPADVPAMCGVLARAFHDDPVYRFAIPDPARRARALPGLMRTLVVVLHADMGPTEVAVAGGHVVGVAAWHDPGAPAPGHARTARALPGLARATRGRLPAFGAFADTLEAHRPEEPHRYLFHLGTDPGWWGQGVGTTLLTPVLAGADARGELVHLETRPENVGYYRRFGFDVTGEVDTAVALVTMGRSPR